MNFGFLIFPGLEELDLVGPWEMIAMWGKALQGPERCLMVAQTADPVVCAKGMTIVPHLTFAACPALDFLLVPGGEGTRRQVDNAALIQFIADHARNCRAVLSVCTGALLLHRAGLLAGRKATTHWSAMAALRGLDGVNVCPQRIVHDGPVWTAAGVSAGIDLALAFIAATAGEIVAGKVQLGTEYYPATRYFGDLHRSAMAPAYLREPQSVFSSAPAR